MSTQSVCKHCQQPKGDLVHSRWAAPELHHKFEPVAERASTGEQPTRLHCGCPDENHLQSCPTIFGAARPSGPSAPPRGFDPRPDLNWPLRSMRPAPQTSVELECNEKIINNNREIVGLCNLKAGHEGKCPAPQPVSGDAPKVEEIRQLAATMFGIMRRGMLNLSMKTNMPSWRELGHSSQEHWKTMARYALEALPFMRPYFPPASQTPINPKEFARKYRERAKNHESESYREASSGSVAMSQLYNGFASAYSVVADEWEAIAAAIPASTARTDGWVSREENQPESSQKVLTFGRGGYQISGYQPENHRFDVECGSDNPWTNHVTHWRELPAAPGSVPQTR